MKLINLVHLSATSQFFKKTIRDSSIGSSIIVTQDTKPIFSNDSSQELRNTKVTKEIKKFMTTRLFFVSFQYGNGYKTLQNSLNTIFKNNNAENKFNLRAVFKTNKISSYFSNKLKTASGLAPNIVFRFKCQRCDRPVHWWIYETPQNMAYGARTTKAKIYSFWPSITMQ